MAPIFAQHNTRLPRDPFAEGGEFSDVPGGPGRREEVGFSVTAPYVKNHEKIMNK